MKKRVFPRTKINLYFMLSLLFAAFSALWLICTAFVDIEGTAAQSMGAYIIAIGFWLSLGIELYMVWMCSRERRKAEQKEGGTGTISQFRLGIVSFGKTTEGMIADVSVSILLIVVIVLVWARVRSQGWILTTVSLLYLSAHAHSLFNGKNYRYIRFNEDEKEEVEHE